MVEVSKKRKGSGMAGGKKAGAKVKSNQVQKQERRGEAAAAASGGSTAQAWPALKKRNAILSRNELRELDLFTVPNFLCIKECEAFIQCAVALGFQHQGSRGPAYGEAYRDNGRVSVQSRALAEKLWDAGLNSVFQDIDVHGRRAVGLNPNIRFYRYTVGQRFGQHIDESVELGGILSTEYTLLIYLTGGEEPSAEGKASREQLVGGDTVFYNRRHVVAEGGCRYLLLLVWLCSTFTGSSACCMKQRSLLKVSSMFCDQMLYFHKYLASLIKHSSVLPVADRSVAIGTP